MTQTKLSTVEAITVILTIFVAHSIVSMPRNLLLSTKTATIINVIYVGIIAILVSYLIYLLLRKFPSCDIIDISEYLGGKLLQSIVGFIFIAYFIFSSAIVLRNFCEGLKVVYYPMTNIIFILLTYVIMLCITNKFEFATTSRVNLLILPIVFISVVFVFFANFKNFSLNNMYPILGGGFMNTFVTGLGNIGAFGGICLIYFIPPYLKEPKKMKKITLISLGLGLVYILLCVATILFMFSFLINVDEMMPLYSAARYIEFGSFFQRLESAFLLIWMIEIACYLSIISKISMNILKKITNIKDTKPLSYIFALLIFGVSFIPENYAISKYLENNVYHITVFVVVLALAFSLLIIANLKRRKKRVGASYE